MLALVGHDKPSTNDGSSDSSSSSPCGLPSIRGGSNGMSPAVGESNDGSSSSPPTLAIGRSVSNGERASRRPLDETGRTRPVGDVELALGEACEYENEIR